MVYFTKKNNKETHDSKDNYLHRNRGIHDYSKIISTRSITLKLFFRFERKKETRDSKDNYLHRSKGIHDYSKIISIKNFFFFHLKEKGKRKKGNRNDNKETHD